ncbi:MAG TPA: hypothetical protein VNE40_01660 [Candidatus Dormibacteraeota bacterium]|nr:hypothetical protein [Candidatus Dormibacteraeota bacterium]
MYSGSTFTVSSGRLLGAHQKIDRVSRRHLERLAPGCRFPSIKNILHFEGHKGPDAIKRKSPAKNEPWHYFQPFEEDDDQLLELISDHYKQLVTCLASDDQVRAAFEAAWLAHAIVDGLTPAHHFPYEEKLVELRSGKGIETRNTIKKKLVLPGLSRRNQLHNNWQMWGPKGLFTTHSAFEMGVATLIAPLALGGAIPSHEDIEQLARTDIKSWFKQAAQDIAKLKIYDRFYNRGWTVPLAYLVQHKLVPDITRAVTVVWFGAAREAGVLSSSKK